MIYYNFRIFMFFLDFAESYVDENQLISAIFYVLEKL